MNGVVLKRCATARKTGSYIANDWVLAVTYDNTKTVIDGGIVTSGTIQLAGSGGSILAGITGNGTAATSIRIWAGASYENRATAPFRVMQNGSVVMENAVVKGEAHINKGDVKNIELTDVRIHGSFTNAFQNGYYVLGDSGGIIASTLGLQNNNNVVIPGTGGSWNTAFQIPFDLKYSGFRAIILNGRFGTDYPSGVIVSNKAPSGKYFYENGKTSNQLTLNPYEAVEMIGYGDRTTFFGWIILRRFYTDPRNMRGFPFHASYMGMVNQNGGMVKVKRYDTSSVTSTKLGTGRYKITISPGFSSVNNYLVFLTCDGDGTDGGRYASVYNKTNSSFCVYTGDDSSPNNSGFSFMIVNTTDF